MTVPGDAMIYAGIDEAGYGPILGPLCVASTVFEVSDADPSDGAPDLWQRLQSVICRPRRDPANRIAVDDSKKMKGARGGKAHPLRHLERGVLTFLAARGASEDDGALPPHDAAYFERCGAAVADRPWCRSDEPVALPLGHDAGPLRIDAARLARGMADAGVACSALRVTAIDADDFNRAVARRGNKAALNLDAVLLHLKAIRSAHVGAHPRIVVDRQGGRLRYAADLLRAFPGASIEVLAEHPDLCRYRLTDADGVATVSFCRGGDDRHLPIALASMAAKFTRELFMIRLNRWFAARAVSALRPTAGYAQDGRRFLRDVQPVIHTERIDLTGLVRQV